MDLILTKSVDPIGARSDLTAQGHIAVKPTRHVPVRIPFEPAQTYLDIGGTSACNLASGGHWSNPDGSGTAIFMSVPATAGNFARVWFRFGGRFLYLRIKAIGTTPPIDVRVNGVSYLVPPTDLYLSAESRTLTDAEYCPLIVDDLPADRIHHGVITLPYNPTTSQSITIFGLGVDRNAGYSELPRCVGIISSAFLTTSLANVNLGSGENVAKGFTGIDYSNNDSTAITALTSSAQTATATVASTVGMMVGQPVVIMGASPAEYNGTFTIASVPSATQFTYSFAGSTTSSATVTGATAAWKSHVVTINDGTGNHFITLGPGANDTYPKVPRGTIKGLGYQHKADVSGVVLARVLGAM
ncbi:MAG: hypothetical protein KGL39_39270 [Patescibacteria group bacterium]|nr:hypothetical protein [Patescibacteria group bacterium]